MLTVFLVTFGLLLLGISLMCIRIILVPGGEFHGSCSSNNPYNKREGGTCAACGRRSDEYCPNAGKPGHEHHHHHA